MPFERSDGRTYGTRELDIGVFGWRIEYQFSSHWMDFKLYEYVCEGFAGPDDVEGHKEFQRKGAPFSPDGVTDMAEAETSAEGFVKWDGCCEIGFGDAARHHLCGREGLKNLTDALLACFDLAKEIIPDFDHRD